MADHPELDHTADAAPSDPLDAALAAAFGADSGPPLAAAGSVVQALGAAPVQLREPATDPADPVVKPRSDALPSDPPARLQIHGEIARGGMGAILKGRDTELGRDVAVKVLLETHQGRTELVQRFVEEAQIAGQLQHPGVVPVYEMGRFPDQRPYFTMKLVKGQTLAKLLANRKDPSAERPRFLGIFLQVCQALAYAHARGVIHRDLKPSNVMVGAFGEVQVMDWGLAKVLKEGGVADEKRGRERAEPTSAIRTGRAGEGTPPGAGSNTREGSVMGTLAYMAPEQARGEVARLDERADVFGLGAILCEILTGEAPYGAEKETEVYRRATQADLGAARARLDGCGADAELIALAGRCLAAEPANRPRDAGALAAELTVYLESVEQRLRRAELERARAEVKAVEERKRRRVAVGLAAAVLALVLVGGGGAAWVAHDRATRAAAEAARVREIEGGASAELERADELRAQARRKPGGDSGLTASALAAARRAEGLLANGGDDDLRRRAAALVAELQDEERDRRMVARLAEARLRAADQNMRSSGKDAFFDDAVAAPLFAEAFRDYGTDVERLPFAEAAERLAARPIRAELAAALDDWARGKPAPADQRKLRDLARAVDDDPTRNRVRDARDHGDVPAMATLAAAPGSDALPPSTVVLLARDLRWGGRATDAADLLRRAVRQHSDDFWVNHELGLALAHLPSPAWDDAIRYNGIAAALRPHSPGAYLNLGGSFLNAGRLDEAVTAYEKALELDPDFVQAHTWLGSARVRLGRIDDAIRSCRKAIELQPAFYQAHNILGDALRIQGQGKESLAACEEAIRLKPDFAEAHNNRGNALLLLDRPDEAVAAYREAIRLAGDFAASEYANLGLVLLLRRGDVAGAIPALQKSLTLSGHGTDKPDLARVWFHLGYAFNEQGRHAEAADALRHAIELRPNEAESHYNLGITLEALGRTDEALAAYRRSAARLPSHAESHLNVGGILAGKGQWDEAIASFRKALDARKEYPKAQNNLAYALRKKGQFDEAIAAARKAVALQPEYAEAHVNLGLAFADKGDFAAAVDELRRGDAQGAKVAGWSLPSAQWLRQCEHMAELDRKLSAAFADPPKPGDAEAWLELAYFAHIQKRRYAAAARLWDRAFQAKPALAAAGGPYCYNAACSAARAGCGQGEDATAVSAAERTRWRKQALEWLRGELTAWEKVLQSVPARAYPAVQQELRHWQQDADLAGLRDTEAVARLPKDEQEACRKLWGDVEALLKKVPEKPK